jgi:hypothetical protein
LSSCSKEIQTGQRGRGVLQAKHVQGEAKNNIIINSNGRNKIM